MTAEAEAEAGLLALREALERSRWQTAEDGQPCWCRDATDRRGPHTPYCERLRSDYADTAPAAAEIEARIRADERAKFDYYAARLRHDDECIGHDFGAECPYYREQPATEEAE
jgi:hypothetical protein